MTIISHNVIQQVYTTIFIDTVKNKQRFSMEKGVVFAMKPSVLKRKNNSKISFIFLIVYPTRLSYPLNSSTIISYSRRMQLQNNLNRMLGQVERVVRTYTLCQNQWTYLKTFKYVLDISFFLLSTLSYVPLFPNYRTIIPAITIRSLFFSHNYFLF